MRKPLYDVILTDQIAGNRERQEVAAHLARRLGQDTRLIAELLRTGDHVIKRRVDAPAGKQYLQALEEAGAVGRLRPAAADGRRPGAAVDLDLPVRVISPRSHPADVAFAPIQANRITHAEGGIDVNRIDTPPITYRAISLLAVYADPEAEQTYVLIFRKNQKRPFSCDADRIVFSDFAATRTTSVNASLRLFIGWIACRHTALRVDPPTAGFFGGRPPAILEIDPVRYTTMLGKTLISMAGPAV